MATVEDVAERLGLGVDMVRHALREGKLRGRKIGRMWFVGDEAIEEYRREHLGQKGWTVRKSRETGEEGSMQRHIYKRELADGSPRWDATVYTRDPVTDKRRQLRRTFTTQEEAKSWLAERVGRETGEQE